VIGNLITPLIYGKILYTPRNNFTEMFVTEVIKKMSMKIQSARNLLNVYFLNF
jgi:hypothetical protein